MEDEKKEKGFVIKDKRLFGETGDVREAELKREEKTTSDEEKQTSTETGSENRDNQKTEEHYPEVNFISFVLSLSTSVMYHFGDFPDPVTKKAERNLSAAKQTIDILNMLKNKTAGNLDENEKSLIDGILYELMMRYVKEMAGE